MAGGAVCVGEARALADDSEGGAVRVKHSGLVSSCGAVVFPNPVAPGGAAQWDLVPLRCRLDIAECVCGLLAGPPEDWAQGGLPRCPHDLVRYPSVCISWSDQTKVFGPDGSWMDQVTGMAWWMHSRLSVTVDRTGDAHAVRLHTDGGPSNPEETCALGLSPSAGPLHFFVYLYRDQDSDDEDGECSEMAPEVLVVPRS
eukprot:TRINITY_DN12973_c0_g1_i1.p1 TRINITY_DN12973_c0_g1~~TRINITY_DN12973_c0_g1_i1.p1  ORF type:complete len:199 (+),score=30.35 TRINITY_DN12973_c0_g1_i1:77-673(+)